MKRLYCTILAGIFLGCFLIAGSAFAIDIQNFHTAMGGQNLFNMYTSDTLEPWQFTIGASSNISGDPLDFSLPGDEELNVVEQLVSNQFYFLFGLGGYVDLGVGSSYNLISGQDLDRGAEVDTIFAADNDTSFSGAGDLDIVLKGRILENKPGWVGLSLVGFLNVPTGNPDYYLSSGAIDGGGLLVLDKRFDRLNIVLNAGYKRKSVAEGADETDIIPSDEILMGLGLSVWAHRFVDVIAEVNGKTVDYGLDNIDAEIPIELELGARLYGGYGFSFLVAGGGGITSGIGSPTYRAILGVEFTWPPIDRQAPWVSRGGPAVDADSKTEDSDRDGLVNYDENNKYGTDFMKPDTDNDGLLDGDEVLKYKTDPKKADTDADDLTDGEEVKLHNTNPLVMDSDGDTIADGVEVKEMLTNPSKADSDNDNVPDNLDGAPLQPETVNNYQDEDGVPEVTLAKRPTGVTLFEKIIWLPEKIVWTGPRQDKIAPESEPMLNDIAVIMSEYSDLKVQIECHVARGGSSNADLTLTQNRADNVRKYLISRGVDQSRMSAVGSGSDYPVASNSKPEGREKNRRTEFKVLEK